MNKYILTALKTVFSILLLIIICPTVCYAWGDSDDGRPSYTIDEINKGAIGATFESDGEDYKNSENYPGQIIFNTVSDSVMGNEKNYVSARECNTEDEGGTTKETIWEPNDIAVEDGKNYIIRMYVANDNPNGWDAVAENTRVRFAVPYDSARSIKVNGFITTDNASPKEYLDYVNFNSDYAFHLEYVKGSALIENKGKVNGSTLSDDIVNTIDGVLIGYDTLDGRIPGGYAYDSYISIEVKAVFDYDFIVEQKVRVIGSEDKEYKYAVNADIDHIVEFQIQYKNTSNDLHEQVMIRAILPKSLQYIEGTTKLYNDHINGAVNEEDTIATTGVNIANYNPGANAYIRFRAKVVGDTMAYGANELISWAQAQAGVDGNEYILQTRAIVYVNKTPEKTPTSLEVILIALIGLCLLLIALCVRKIYKRKRGKKTGSI